MQVKSGFADLNGTQLYYEEAGSGFPVIFIHGFTLDTRMWEGQFVPLSEDYRVIRYDMRGFGKSALPTEVPYSQVDDLEALLDHLAIDAAAIVSHSRGGAVALDFALTHPARTEALVLIDSVLGGFSWSQEASQRDGLVWERAKEGGIPAAKESWITHPLFAPALRQPEVAAGLSEILDDFSGWHFVNANPEIYMDPPAFQRLQELSMPILAIVGELDLPDFRQITQLICESVTQAHEVIVSDAGHMAPMEAPDYVTSALSQFLKEHLPKG